MKESIIISEFRQFLSKNPKHPLNFYTFVAEFKICKTNRFNFNGIKSHQIEGLYSAQLKGFSYKIPDEGLQNIEFRARRKKNPFDFIHTCVGCSAYVAVCFYQPRKLKRLFFFTLEQLFQMKAENKYKSFTIQDAEKYCETYIDLIKCHTLDKAKQKSKIVSESI